MANGSIYSACWDFARLGLTGTGAVFTGGSVGTTVFTTGLYCHADPIPTDINGDPLGTIDGQTLNSFCIDFVGGGDNAAITNLSLSYNETTMAYTMASSGGVFAVAFTGDIGTELRKILGFASDLASAASYTSTLRPKYIIVPRVRGQSAVHAPYEPSGRVNYAESDDGTSYSTYPDTIPMYSEWTQPFETNIGPTDTDWTTYGSTVAGAPMRISDVGGMNKVSWSWEDFYKHIRSHIPFRLHNSGDTSGYFYKMLPAAANFDPARVTKDFDGYWSPQFKVILKTAWYYI